MTEIIDDANKKKIRKLTAKQKRERVLARIKKYAPVAMAAVSVAANVYLTYRNENLRAVNRGLRVDNDSLWKNSEDHRTTKDAYREMLETGEPQHFVSHRTGMGLFSMIPYVHENQEIKIVDKTEDEKKDDAA